VERNRISSSQSHGKALEKECCLPSVFCDSGDTTKFYRPDALPDAQPTVSKHRMQAIAMNGSAKFAKMGWFGVVMRHSRSWATPSFDRAHTTSYSTFFRPCVYILPFSRYSRFYLSKVADFDPPHLHLACPYGVPRQNFAEIYDIRKIESMGYRVVLIV